MSCISSLRGHVSHPGLCGSAPARQIRIYLRLHERHGPFLAVGKLQQDTRPALGQATGYRQLVRLDASAHRDGGYSEAPERLDRLRQGRPCRSCRSSSRLIKARAPGPKSAKPPRRRSAAAQVVGRDSAACPARHTVPGGKTSSNTLPTVATSTPLFFHRGQVFCLQPATSRMAPHRRRSAARASQCPPPQRITPIYGATLAIHEGLIAQLQPRGSTSRQPTSHSGST